MKPELSKSDLSRLSQKSSARGLKNLACHLGLLIVFGVAFVWSWQSGSILGLILSWIFYTTVFSFLGYAGLGHELNHRTVFESTAANELLFAAVSMLTWNNPVYFRASHQIHHANTLKKGLDFEVVPDRSDVLSAWWKYAVVDPQAARRAWQIFRLNASGQVTGPLAQTAFAQGTPRRKELINMARLTVAAHAGVLILALANQAWWWIFLINLAAFGSTWLNRVCARLQHEGMQANADDFKQTTRTVVLPVWLARLYWNMNYHLEHHSWPAVPFHALPELHGLIAAQGTTAAAEGLTPSLKLLQKPAAPIQE